MQPKAPANTIPFKIENVFEIQMHQWRCIQYSVNFYFFKKSY